MPLCTCVDFAGVLVYDSPPKNRSPSPVNKRNRGSRGSGTGSVRFVRFVRNELVFDFGLDFDFEEQKVNLELDLHSRDEVPSMGSSSCVAGVVSGGSDLRSWWWRRERTGPGHWFRLVDEHERSHITVAASQPRLGFLCECR